jgi:hypothetical protein
MILLCSQKQVNLIGKIFILMHTGDEKRMN